MNDLTVLVNTCDAYCDLWDPFFRLYYENWGERGREYPVVLNTENSEYTCPFQMNVLSHKYTGKRGTWADRLYCALRDIESEFVLFLLDDFFFADAVHTEIVDEVLKYMRDNPNIACFNMQKPYYGNNEQSEYQYFDKRKNGDLYTLTCQPAIWRRKKLMKYINRNEDAWQFEQFGSARTLLYPKDEFYILSESAPNIFEYNFNVTDGYGVCRGKWHPATPVLFDRYGIEMDYNLRGFYSPQDLGKPIQKAKRNLADQFVRGIFRYRKIKERYKR